MITDQKIEVRDIRDGQFLWMDKSAWKYVTRKIGPSGAVVYAWLCYYANTKSQDAWPSVTTLELDTSLGRRTIIRALAALDEIQAITTTRVAGGHNSYTLLEIQPELFSEVVPKWHRCQNGTGAKIDRGTSANAIYKNNMIKSNKMIKAAAQKAAPVENSVDKQKPNHELSAELKSAFKSVGKKGLNMYSLTGRFYKNSRLREPLPDKVLLGVCASYERNGSGVNRLWPWFVKALHDESAKYFAEKEQKRDESETMPGEVFDFISALAGRLNRV